jgi:hypothetical protein
MKRAPALALIAIMVAIVPALAAGLSTTSASLGGSGATVTRCDSDGVGVIGNLSGSNVVSVTVSNLAPACGSGSLSVTVSNGSTNSTGTGVVPGGGGSLTVTLGSPIAATNAMTTDLAIVGA